MPPARPRWSSASSTAMRGTGNSGLSARVIPPGWPASRATTASTSADTAWPRRGHGTTTPQPAAVPPRLLRDSEVFMLLRTFGGSFGVTAVGRSLAFLSGGPTGLAVAAILTVLEISVSFDNAVVNATVLGEMSQFWQKIFLTVGVLIAVFGMRLAFPLIIVGITAHLTPTEAVQLALKKGSVDESGSYANLLHEAHPAIAAFGGMFLLMLFLDFIFEEREITWLSWLERPLARIGKLDQLSVVVASVLLLVSATQFAPHGKAVSVLMSGVLGMITYILVNGLGGLLEDHEVAEDDENEDEDDSGSRLLPDPARPVTPAS